WRSSCFAGCSPTRRTWSRRLGGGSRASSESWKTAASWSPRASCSGTRSGWRGAAAIRACSCSTSSWRAPPTSDESQRFVTPGGRLDALLQVEPGLVTQQAPRLADIERPVHLEELDAPPVQRRRRQPQRTIGVLAERRREVHRAQRHAQPRLPHVQGCRHLPDDLVDRAMALAADDEDLVQGLLALAGEQEAL